VRLWALVAGAALCLPGCAAAPAPARAGGDEPGTATVRRGAFVREVRATGTTEAVRSSSTVAPRLAGQSSYNLMITRLVAGGSRVRAGDVLVEFDRQDQVRAALDRRAEYLDLEQQILKKKADQDAALAADQTALTVADHDVGRARLEVEKNQFLARIDAEKNDLALEQATARLAQLREALALKARSAAADIRILEIRRDRARLAWRNAEANADVMIGRAPFDGLALLRSTFRGNNMARVQEGDEVYAGTPVVDVVDPARMQVRVRINQVDGGAVRPGQPATIRLDAYPDLVFEGRVEQVAPLAASSQLTARVRTFSALVAISGSHEKLMPDLSAAVDIIVERLDNVLMLPRAAVKIDRDGAAVEVRGPGRAGRQAVTLGSASADYVVIASGVDESAVVTLNAGGAGR
jgi:multidrug efflux pump subunit AcrA (membrane-fusion protein)